MPPISQHELKAHHQRLRQIFSQNFRCLSGEQISVELTVVPSNTGAIASCILQSGPSTEIALNERKENDVCGVLKTDGGQRILCSFFESWDVLRPNRNPKYKFRKVAFTFFLSFQSGEQTVKKQLFRLDWDNWENNDPPNKAAYPHWQFDRWLTASEFRISAQAMESNFAAPTEAVKVFDPSEGGRPTAQERPSLSWFGSLHFPAIAPWAIRPAVNLDAPELSHRSLPQNTKQLGDWIESALIYLNHEVTTYG